MVRPCAKKVNVAQVGRAQDVAVMSTNDDAFESKIAAMDVGYFDDRYLRSMKEEYLSETLHTIRRRQPVMNRGTYARVYIKDEIMTACLALPQVRNASTVQIVSLGAGFDTFPFRLIERWRGESAAKQLPFLNYVEVDLEPVVKMKRRLGRHFLGEDGQLFTRVKRNGRSVACWEKERSKYSLHACDLRDLEEFKRVMFSQGEDGGQLSAEVDVVTVVVAEISLVYMAAREADAVIEGLSRWLSGARVFVNLEPVQGGDQFGELMDANVAARGSALLGMRTYPSMGSQMERFRRLGWESCSGETMLRLWKAMMTGPGQVGRLQAIELLDEVEELHLLLSHYCVVVASDGTIDTGSVVGGMQ